MDFELNEVQRMMADTAERFAQKEVVPWLKKGGPLPELVRKMGEVGLFDLGHAGFYAIGAYTTAILNTSFHIPVLLLIPVSAVAAGLFAYLVCSPIIHLKGDYLCIVTIGMGEIIRLALLNNPFDITGGPNGVFGIDTPTLGFFEIDTSLEFFF